MFCAGNMNILFQFGHFFHGLPNDHQVTFNSSDSHKTGTELAVIMIVKLNYVFQF